MQNAGSPSVYEALKQKHRAENERSRQTASVGLAVLIECWCLPLPHDFELRSANDRHPLALAFRMVSIA